DDSATVSISGTSVSEGNSGTTDLAFTITLSKPVDEAVTLQFDTPDGTAHAPADYAAQATVTVTIPANSTSVTHNVQVQGDTTVEADETLTATISNVSAPGRSVSLSATTT